MFRYSSASVGGGKSLIMWISKPVQPACKRGRRVRVCIVLRGAVSYGGENDRGALAAVWRRTERYRACRPRQLLLLRAGLLQSPMGQYWRRAAVAPIAPGGCSGGKCGTWDTFAICSDGGTGIRGCHV